MDLIFLWNIRLLILHPSPRRSKDIKCTLKEFAMDEAPESKALSYACGQPCSTRHITVNDLGIPVGRNLHHALWYLRSQAHRTLWVDALSINQENIAERNQQAMQMSNIYRNSWRVLVWLGIPSTDSDEALKCIASCHYHDKEFTPNNLLPIKRLFEREYWSRLWIVQECLDAKDARIQCGNTYVSWDKLDTFRARCRFAWKYSVHESALLVFGSHAFKLLLHHTMFGLQQKTPLRALLHAFSSSKCVDVRDKIYGLVGLAKGGGKLEIDYSYSVSRVFGDVI
ncbi:heterokaryon incompatibility protein-domain-containing protein, partial [Rhexocercosporidium sp. MPI-PUGE-AT-0058]